MTVRPLVILSGVLLLCPFFFIGGPGTSASALLNNLWNYGHIIFFAALVLLILEFRSFVVGRNWLWLALIILVLGIAIELIQKLIGRDFSWSDVAHNLLGAFLALAWGQRATNHRVLLVGLRVLGVIFIIPALWLSAQLIHAEWQMRAQFPLINSFESAYELRQIVNIGERVVKRQSSHYFSQGKFSLAVKFTTDTYSGIKWVGRYGDWTPYHYFVADIYSPGVDAFPVVLKIADLQHDQGNNAVDDRFNRRLTLVPGWNSVRIAISEIRTAPAKRQMRIHEVSCLELFAVRLPKPQVAYIDNVRLE